MSALHIETTGILAVKQLRKSKLSQGFFFMITSKDLSPGHAYLEYPNGQIELVTAKKDAVEFTTISEKNIT